LGYISPTIYKEIKNQIEELIRIINGYIAFLKRSKRGANEPGANQTIREDPAPYFTDNPNELSQTNTQ
jgi:hypothetical protein